MDVAGIGNAASQLMDDMKKSSQQTTGHQQEEAHRLAAEFQGRLQQTRETQLHQQKFVVNKAELFRRAQQASSHGGALAAEIGYTKRTQRSTLIKTMNKLIRGQDEMTTIMDQAMSGKMFTSPEVLAMQANVFHYVQELEYSVKILDTVDKGTKQILNTQLGGG